MPILLKDLTSEQLHDWLVEFGVSLHQARQIHASVVRRGRLPGTDRGIAAKTLQQVGRLTAIPNLTLVDKRVSPQDGFAKYLFLGDGPGTF